MKFPFICVRDIVAFPNSTLNLLIDRKISYDAILLSQAEFKNEILLIVQKKTEQDKPNSKADLFNIGTLCRMTGVIRLQDGTVQARFLGLKKFKIKTLDFSGFPMAEGQLLAKKVTQKTKVTPQEISRLIELFVRAKPYVVFDEEAHWLKEVLRAKNNVDLSRVLQSHLNYSNSAGPHLRPWLKKDKKECKWVNKRNILQQTILESNQPADQLSKIRSYLINEVRSGLANT